MSNRTFWLGIVALAVFNVVLVIVVLTGLG